MKQSTRKEIYSYGCGSANARYAHFYCFSLDEAGDLYFGVYESGGIVVDGSVLDGACEVAKGGRSGPITNFKSDSYYFLRRGNVKRIRKQAPAYGVSYRVNMLMRDLPAEVDLHIWGFDARGANEHILQTKVQKNMLTKTIRDIVADRFVIFEITKEVYTYNNGVPNAIQVAVRTIVKEK